MREARGCVSLDLIETILQEAPDVVLRQIVVIERETSKNGINPSGIKRGCEMHFGSTGDEDFKGNSHAEKAFAMT